MAVLDSMWIPDFLLVELRFLTEFVSGTPDSLSCIADSKAEESGFHKQTFLRFQIPPNLQATKT